MNDIRKFKFEELFERGIKKEKNISDSFFFDVYAQAYDLVDEIVLKNEHIKTTLKCNSDCFMMPQSVTDINNVIAFTGRRGTGKTSAMLSFSDFLMNNEPMGKYNSKNKLFLTLPYIDSAMINAGEDFFDIIISKMLKIIYSISDSCNCYRNYDDSNIEKIEELKSDIANVYSYYSSLKYEKILESIPSYSVMEKVMQKHDVRSKVIDVIKKFNNVVGMVHKGIPYDYMVICLDDIDMVRTGHVEIMQLIYQYFMIPGVIVMVTFNTEYLTAMIEKEFYSNIEFANGTVNKPQRNLDISQNQTYDFLRKIIPSDMRITMPSWRKNELRNLFPVNIELPKNCEDFNKFSRLTDDFIKAICDLYTEKRSKDRYLTPKEIVMLFLADRTHCYLDSRGYKLHFIEPDSLRNLYDIFYLLYEMKPVEKEKEHLSLEYNRRILLNYLHFRMIPGYNLPYRVSQQIDKLEINTMERRGKIIWENYYQRLFEKENDVRELYGEEFIKKERKRHFVENYNLGEMFRCLYFGSRLELFDKNYVKSVLASYAFAMPQFVESQKHNRNSHHDKILKSDKQNLFENPDILYRFSELRYIFGYSLIGEWRSNLFNDRNVIITINKNIFNSGKLRDNIKHFIYLLLLSKHSGDKYIKYEKIGDEENPQYRIYTSLDPTAFIMGTVRVHRIIKFRFSNDSVHSIDLKELIEEILIPEKKDKVDISNYISDVIKEIYGEKYFYKEKENNWDSNEFIWFLLKNVDITYNVIKRTVKSFLYFSDENLNYRETEGTPFETMKKFYMEFMKNFKDTIKIYKGYKQIKDMLNTEYSPTIIDWFINSDSYGKYCCILEAENKKNCFYQYGCGMEYDNNYPVLNSLEQFIRSFDNKNITYYSSDSSSDELFFERFSTDINNVYLITEITSEQENQILDIFKDYEPVFSIDYNIVKNKIISILEQGNFMKFGTFLEYILDKEDYNIVASKIKDDLLEIEIPELIQRKIEKYISQDYEIDEICNIIEKFQKENSKNQK